MTTIAPNDFTHLHVHSEFSLLDGLGRINDLVDSAAQQGFDSLALTDHGALYGAVAFYQAATAKGIKPIIGVETYVARRSMADKEGKADAQPFHLILLAKDDVGYRNLCRLVTDAHLDGYYYKPRIDREHLARHSQGLIGLSACLGGEIPRALETDDWELARKLAGEYGDIFGKDGFFLELQDHGLAEQRRLNEQLLRLAPGGRPAAGRDQRPPLRPRGPVGGPRRPALRRDRQQPRHARPAEVRDPRVLPEVGGPDGGPLPGPARGDPQHPPDRRDDRRARAARSASSGSRTSRCPTARRSRAGWRAECQRGLAARYGTVTPELQERLDYELGVITSMGYAGYFLIVADFVRFAREQRIQTTCRGSAPGSIVTYTLGITPVDPILYQLPFERFLNPDRVTMPDIDVDFEDGRREEVIAYVGRKYGQDHVAQIITFGTMLARAAIRDVGRVLGMSYGEVDRIAKAVPNQLGIKLDEALQVAPQFRELVEADPQVGKLVDLARQLEGVTRNASTHAAGVVISREPLTELMPLQRATNSDGLMTQFEMHAVEALGLLKFDFLGLSNLTILRQAVELVQADRGIAIDLDAIPLDDATTFELLASGETTGIFQLESAGMRRYIRELRPTSVYDLAAMVALYRPGPMDNIPAYIRRKHGQEPVTYLHPLLEPYLEKTYGIFVYQEDIMAAAIALGGFTGPEADTLGYAIRKKKSSVLRAQKERFVTQAAERGVPAQTIDAVFKAFEPFERYGFNKAHATCYGLVAYQTAYLKANYTVEYMTSVLTAVRDTSEKVAAAIAECRRLGIEVLPPDVHRSDVEFTVEGDAIRFGLLAVKNVGQGAIESIIAARREGGEFRSLTDLCSRIDLRLANRKVLEALARVGALNALRAPGPDPPRARRRARRRRRRPARPAHRPDLAVRDGRRAGRPRRAAAGRARDADPRAAALGEGAPRAVPVGPSARRDRRGDRAVRDGLLGRPARRVARRAAGRRRRDRDRRPDGHHQGPRDDGDRQPRGPPGGDRGRRLPAALRGDPGDLDGGPDPARSPAGSTTRARTSRCWRTWPSTGTTRPRRGPEGFARDVAAADRSRGRGGRPGGAANGDGNGYGNGDRPVPVGPGPVAAGGRRSGPTVGPARLRSAAAAGDVSPLRRRSRAARVGAASPSAELPADRARSTARCRPTSSRPTSGVSARRTTSRRCPTRRTRWSSRRRPRRPPRSRRRRTRSSTSGSPPAPGPRTRWRRSARSSGRIRARPGWSSTSRRAGGERAADGAPDRASPTTPSCWPRSAAGSARARSSSAWPDRPARGSAVEPRPCHSRCPGRRPASPGRRHSGR